jgi:hypothetical protein
MKSTADYITRPSHRKAYEEGLARYLERVGRAITHDRLEAAWPSSTGGRGATSPLGGVAQPAAEKEPG